MVRLRERAERQHLGDGAAGSCPHRGGDGDRDVTHQSLTKAWKSPEKPMAGGSRGGSSCSTFVSTSKSVLQFWYGNCPVANSTCRGDSGGQQRIWGPFRDSGVPLGDRGGMGTPWGQWGTAEHMGTF